MAPQTPRQRRANERYARQEATKKGKPESSYKKAVKEKNPISYGWMCKCLKFTVTSNHVFIIADQMNMILLINLGVNKY